MRRLRLALVLAGLVVSTFAIFSSAASAASPPVPGLEVCGSQPHCDYGPIFDHFPDYKSVCSNEACYFAAAANWEQVAAGVTPSAALLKSDYTAAGETSGGDLTNPQDLWTYWGTSGIDGIYLYSESVISKAESTVENAVKAHRAVIAEDSTSVSAFIGLTKYGAGTGILIADGYTPKGPIVVFEGKTIQMTWAQWEAQIRSVWEVTDSTTPLQPVTTPPPTSTALPPTATLSLSSAYETSSGGIVTLTFSSVNATSCTLSSVPSLWSSGSVAVPCNGTYQIDVVPSTSPQQWAFTFTASNALDQSAISSQTLVQSAAPTPQFSNPSTNWSGYVVPSSSELVTDVSAEWTVPILNCADTPSGDSAIWIGIGGEPWATGGSSGALLQTGTNDDCVDGVQQDAAWWEVVPASPNHQQGFTDFPVSPGNEIQASVFETTANGWETEVTDVNTGLSAYMVTGESWGVGSTGASTFTVQGSAARISYSGGYTAEWIVEDPEEGSANAGGQLYQFADFETVTFTNMESSFTSWYLTPSEEWGIVQSGVALAAPTNTTADGFTDSYIGP